MAKAKLYSFTDHSTTPSSTVFVCATSQQSAADAVSRPLSHIKKYMSVHTDAKMLNRFKHLKIGQFEKKSNAPKSIDNGMSMRDLDRIAAVGILTSAHIALQQCSVAVR